MTRDVPPITTIFDPVTVDGILAAAANAMSIQLSLGTSWEHDDDWRSDIVWGVNTLNPVAGFKNLLLHGRWTQDSSGAVAVRQDQTRRRRLRNMFITDFRNVFDQKLARSPLDAYSYLCLEVRNTERAPLPTGSEYRARVGGSQRAVRGSTCRQQWHFANAERCA